MKDKLMKTNHKAPYYIMRKAAVACIAIFSVGGAIAIPTYIVNKHPTNNAVLASEVDDDEDTKTSEEETSNDYVSYNDQEN